MLTILFNQSNHARHIDVSLPFATIVPSANGSLTFKLSIDSESLIGSMAPSLIESLSFETLATGKFISMPWFKHEHHGVDEYTKKFTNTPVGEHIAMLSGRILLSIGDTLYATEKAKVGLTNTLEKHWRFNSRIRLLATVGTGTYVGDDKSIYWLGGMDVNDWKLVTVYNYPAVEWAVCQNLVDSAMFGLDVSKQAVIFNTVKGAVIGLPDGSILPLTSKQYKTIINQVAMVHIGDGKILLSGESGGVFVQGALGDFGEKAVTEWDGGFVSVAVDTDGVLLASDDGLYIIEGEKNGMSSV